MKISKRNLLIGIIVLVIIDGLVGLFFLSRQTTPQVSEQSLSSAPSSVKVTSVFPELVKLQPHEEKQVYIDRLLTYCYRQDKKTLQNIHCLKSLGSLLVEQFQFKDIVTAFKNSGKDCHIAMHYSVNAAYQKGASISDIWGQCTNACFGACYHGGLEGIFTSKSLGGASDDTIKTALSEICDEVKNNFAPLESQCFHGLGHAIMLLTKGDLPKSLTYCDSLSQRSKNCYEGVFMENSPGTSTQEYPSKYIKSDDPQYPCNSIADKYKKTCYTYQVSYFNYISSNDTKKVAGLCHTIPDDYQTQCYHAIGTGSPGHAKTVAGYYAICKEIAGSFGQRSCVKGVVDSYKDRYPHDLVRLAEAPSFCAIVDTDFKTDCYQQIGEVLKSFAPSQSQVTEICGKIDEPYRKLCIS